MNKIMYFTATWCGPCRAFGPILSSLVDELKDRVELHKIDGDDNPDIVQEYKIRSFPTIVVLNDQGKELNRHSGLVNKEKLRMVVENAINQG